MDREDARCADAQASAARLRDDVVFSRDVAGVVRHAELIGASRRVVGHNLAADGRTSRIHPGGYDGRPYPQSEGSVVISQNRHPRSALRVAALLALGLAAPLSAFAADDTSALHDAVPPGPDAGERAEGGWDFAVAPYVWLFGMSGKVSKGQKSIPVNLHLGDSVDLVKDNLQFGFAGQFEARKGPWALFFGGEFLQFEGDQSASRSVSSDLAAANVDLKFDVTLDISIVEAGAAYQVAETESWVEGVPWSVDILGGARWTRVAVDLDLHAKGAVSLPRRQATRANDYSPSFTEDWVDPFVGFRTRVPLTEELGLLLRGDIGGGIGSGSKRAWNAVVGLAWRVGETVDLFVGYRWYDFERDSSGRETDLQLAGPGIGAVFRF